MSRTMCFTLLAASAAGGWYGGRILHGLRTQHSRDRMEDSVTGATPQRIIQTVFAASSPRGMWIERVRNAGASDFPSLHAEWEDIFPDDARYEEGWPPNALNALRWMLGMWLVKDSNGFLRAATGDSPTNPQWAAQVMVELMPEKAAELISGARREELDDGFVGGIASAIAESQPALYLKLNPEGTIDHTPGLSNNDWLTAITNLAKIDVRAAGNACLRWKGSNDPTTLNNALLSVVRAWKTHDPPIADWVNAIEDPQVRNFAAHARLFALAEIDPETALKELYAANLEDDNDLHHDASKEILKQLAKSNPVAALKLMRDLEEVFANSTEAMSANPFRHLGPARYSVWGELESNGARFIVLSSIAENLANDPLELITRYRRLTGEAGFGGDAWERGVEGSLIRIKSGRWTVDECFTAAAAWTSKAEASQDDVTLRKLATRAAVADPEQALATMQQFPEQARSYLMGEIIKNLPQADSAIRSELLLQLPPAQWNQRLGEVLGNMGGEFASIVASQPLETSLDARKAFARQWGEQDPEAVVSWLQSLPDDEGARSATSGLAAEWITYDGDAATAWAEDLPPGPARDAAAGSISYWLSMKNSQEAWHWADEISDPKMRAEAYDQVATYWRQNAPEAFRTSHNKARADAGEAPYQSPSGFEENPFE